MPAERERTIEISWPARGQSLVGEYDIPTAFRFFLRYFSNFEPADLTDGTEKEAGSGLRRVHQDTRKLLSSPIDKRTKRLFSEEKAIWST